MNTMLSVIIYFSADTERRVKNLEETLRCLRNQRFGDFETVLVEEAYKENYAGRDFNVDNHVKVKNTLKTVSNPCWEKNVGAREASGEKYLFLDADLVFDDSYMGKVNSLDRNFCWAWTQIYMLNEVGREKYLKGASLPEVKNFRHLKMVPHPMGAAGGSVFFNKKFFWNTGGWNENFFYWGGEDNEIVLRVQHLGGTSSMDFELYHLPHPKTSGKLPNNDRLLYYTKQHVEFVIKKLREASLGKKSNPTII